MVAGVCLTGLRGAHRPPHANWVVHEERWHYECRVGADLALKAAGTLSAPALELGNIIPEWVSNSSHAAISVIGDGGRPAGRYCTVVIGDR